MKSHKHKKSIYIPEALLVQLQALCDKHDRPLSWMIQKLCYKALGQEKPVGRGDTNG